MIPSRFFNHSSLKFQDKDRRAHGQSVRSGRARKDVLGLCVRACVAHQHLALPRGRRHNAVGDFRLLTVCACPPSPTSKVQHVRGWRSGIEQLKGRDEARRGRKIPRLGLGREWRMRNSRAHKTSPPEEPSGSHRRADIRHVTGNPPSPSVKLMAAQCVVYSFIPCDIDFFIRCAVCRATTLPCPCHSYCFSSSDRTI